jgi:integrase
MFADYFRLLLFTMQRRSNVAAMAWADVHFGRRQWTIAGEKTKNGDPLTVSLSDEAMEVLQRRWAQRDTDGLFVFPSRGASGHVEEPKGPWARVCQRAKITNLRIHDLRHTGASWMAIGGSSLPIIGKALGHKSMQSTARYSHVNKSAAAQAMQSATSAMAALANRATKKTTKSA